MYNHSLSSLSSDLNYIIENIQELKEDLYGSRIFLTGGTGFFGCWLVESFLWANAQLGLNAEVVVLTRNLAAFKSKAPHLVNHSAITFCDGDIKNFQPPAGEFSHIIHAASEIYTVSNKNAKRITEDIVNNCAKILDFAVNCKAKKFLLTSSGSVYGKQPTSMAFIPEDYLKDKNNFEPHSAYGLGKLKAENLGIEYAKRSSLEVKIARCFTFVGPYLPLNEHFAIGNFIANGLRNEPIQVKGDGTPIRSYLYAADLAIWLWHILVRGKSCRPYNVGSEEALSIADLAYLVAKCFSADIKVIIDKLPIMGKDIERYVPSTNRVRTELGLEQSIKLIDAIKKTQKWLGPG